MSIQANVSRPTSQSSYVYSSDDVGRATSDEGRSMLVKFIDPANDPFTLVHAATRAMEQMWHGEQVTFLAITLVDLVPPIHQLRAPLYKSGCGGELEARAFLTNEKRHATTKAMDTIRDRHGEESIIFASMLGLSSDYAPDRIGFRKTEGIDVTVGV